jgi:hypothetical protein
LFPLLMRINAYLVRWIRDKYKRLRRRRKAFECMRGIAERHRRMFAHWTWVTAASLSDDQDDKSRMSREAHVRICGSREVRPLPATRQGQSTSEMSQMLHLSPYASIKLRAS